MKKILISIDSDSLVFRYSNSKEKINPDLAHTNVISTSELIFSDLYIESNAKIVTNFVKELASEHKITKVEIQSVELAELVVKILAKIENIEVLSILNDETISFTLSEMIVNSGNIKSVSCYSAPEFIIEYMDRNAVVMESRGELFFTSNFMQVNSLSQYSKIFYKVALRINSPVNDDDLEDLESFCKINKYLKTIHLNACNVKEIRSIINVLNATKKKNIKILIHENITNEADIIELRRLNKQNKKKIVIKLVYSKEYIRDNYLKQVIFTTLKYSALITLLIVGCSFGYISVNNYSSSKKVENINFTIKQVIEKTENPPAEEGEHGPSIIKSLLEVNSDTIGWLTVKGTSIDYPVVQAIDNSYYLNKNYNKEKDYSGWVFADYRNNIETLDKNTILYAHNRFNSDVMFGSLKNVLKDKWLEDKENYVITFNTLYAEMRFEVFAAYTIKNTNDYITTNFDNDNEYLDFIDMIRERSEINTDRIVSTNDKILTLSTCAENNRRLVVHAVLLEDE